MRSPTWNFDPDGPWLRKWAHYCNGTVDNTEWRVYDPADPTDPPPPRPQDFLPALLDEQEEALPVPTLRTPADTDERHHAYVQVPTFFWVDDATWAPVSVTAGIPGVLSVTTTATPTKLTIDPGDNTGPFDCTAKPVPYERGVSQVEQMPKECSHTYTNSSALAPNGESFAVDVTMTWHVTWSSSNGEAGDLGELVVGDATRQLPVAEIQAIVTGGG